LKNLVLGSFFVLVLAGCTPSVYNNFKRIPVTADNKAEIRPWFKSDDDHFLFQCGINVFRNHFTGLMVVKPLPDEDYRVVFINEVGIKIFDMEFFGTGGYRVHYCLEYLNKKLFIRTLKNDISLMLNNQPGDHIRTMTDSKNGYVVYKFRNNTGVKYFLVNGSTNRIKEIIQKRGLSKKVNISFYSSMNTELDSVRISHYNVKLDIHLAKINENK
jgi:predicted RNase H-related nuclease YkuK (DUF458 family)